MFAVKILMIYILFSASVVQVCTKIIPAVGKLQNQ